MNITFDTSGGFIRATGTEARVCQFIAHRQQNIGIPKYGVTVQDTPLNLLGWLKHQQAELSDALIYCTRAIEEMEKQQDDLK